MKNKPSQLVSELESWKTSFFKTKKNLKSSINTIKAYENTFLHFDEFCIGKGTKIKMSDINQLFFHDFISFMEEKGDIRMKDYKTSTINNHLTKLRAFFYFIDRHTDKKFKYAEKLEGLKIKDRHIMKDGLSDDEVSKILERIEYEKINSNKKKIYAYRNALIFKILLSAPYRASEFLKLKFEDLLDDGEFYSMTVYETKENTPKELFVRKDFINDELSKLKRDFFISSQTPVAFRYDLKTHICRTELYDMLTALYARAGVSKKGVHIIRHTVASHDLSNGVPIQIVSKKLGHKSIATTEKRYAKVNRESLKQSTSW